MDPTVSEGRRCFISSPVVSNSRCGLVGQEVGRSPQRIGADIVEALADSIVYIVTEVSTE